MSRNIGGEPNDTSYRYKMPILKAKVEGRGNGIKTRIVNMADIAKAVKRDPAYITKYFGCELCTVSKWNSKTNESIVNGSHTKQALDKILDKFIAKWVICPACALPETDLLVRKGTIYADCKACGKRSKCDMHHRIANFILKHPPKKSDRQKAGVSTSKSSGGGRRTKSSKSSSPAPASDETDKLAKEAEKLSVSGKDKKGEEEPVQWTTDMSQEAAKKRAIEALGATGKDLIVSDNDEVIAKDLVKFLNDASNSTKAKIEKIKTIQKTESYSQIRTIEVVFNAYYDEKILTKIAKSAPIFQAFIGDSVRCQKHFIGCFERLAEAHAGKPTDIIPKIADILMGFYDSDIIDEDILIDWYDVPLAKYVEIDMLERIRKKAFPFIEWLKNADEEGDSDEEDEEDDSDEEDAPSAASKPASSNAAISSFLDDDSDSDSDIDLDDL